MRFSIYLRAVYHAYCSRANAPGRKEEASSVDLFAIYLKSTEEASIYLAMSEDNSCYPEYSHANLETERIPVLRPVFMLIATYAELIPADKC
jgi:hypothetical protein